MIPLHSPLDLLLFATGGDDQPVVVAVTSRLYQYRSFADGDAIRLPQGECCHQLTSTGADRRMDQRVQFFEALGLVKDQGAKAAAVDPAIGTEDSAAEFGDHGLVRFPARLEHGVTQFVGLNQQAPHLLEGAADGSFSAGKTACESNFQHGNREAQQQLAANLRGLSANATLSLISEATEIGPPPPEPRAEADPRGRRSEGWTSHPSTQPLRWS